MLHVNESDQNTRAQELEHRLSQNDSSLSEKNTKMNMIKLCKFEDDSLSEFGSGLGRPKADSLTNTFRS